MRRLPLVLSVLASTTAALLACSSDTTTSTLDAGTPKPDSGGGTDSGGTDSGGGGDSATPLNGCTTYVDLTAAGAARTITWALPLSDANKCMKVKTGQSVTWTGSFTSHPLAPQGGTTPNPITSSGATTNDAGQSTATITFANAGDYGYICSIHASMIGAIQVVP